MATDNPAYEVIRTQAHHACLIAAKASEREILVAYRAVMVATVRLAVDSGEDEMPAIYEIEDVDAVLARMAA